MSTDANARGARPSLGHIRGLDGTRAVSVLAINDPARTHLDNTTMRPVADAADVAATGGGGEVCVYDLNAQVSPAYQCTASIGRINVRCSDGVQFSSSGGISVGLRLVPQPAGLGQPHAVSSPIGAWPGRLPPSTPPWYANLTCE